MHALFELVKKDPETWTPIEKLGAVMPLIGEPQVGDFMAEQDGRSAFFCTEVLRVRVARSDASGVHFEASRGIPNWFNQVQSSFQATPDGVLFGGIKLKAGDSLVLDNMVVRVESASEATAS